MKGQFRLLTSHHEAARPQDHRLLVGNLGFSHCGMLNTCTPSEDWSWKVFFLELQQVQGLRCPSINEEELWGKANNCIVECGWMN